MSDPRGALARVQLDHQDTTGCGCRCGETFQTWEEKRAHVADAVLTEFLVVPRSDIVGTEYGWREKSLMHPNQIATREAALLAAEEERQRQIASGAEPTAEAVERLPWSPIPLPEDGEPS